MAARASAAAGCSTSSNSVLSDWTISGPSFTSLQAARRLSIVANPDPGALVPALCRAWAALFRLWAGLFGVLAALRRNTPRGAPQRGQDPEGRPSGQTQRARPSGARPSGARPSGARPSGARPSGARPSGARPRGRACRRRSVRVVHEPHRGDPVHGVGDQAVAAALVTAHHAGGERDGVDLVR